MKVTSLSRSNAVSIALFAVAFVSVLVFSRMTATAEQEASVGAKSSTFGVGPLLRRHRTAAPVLPAQNAKPPKTTESKAGLAPPSADQIREYQQASRDARDAEEGEDRGIAIRRLATAATPEAVAALSQVLRNDEDVRNRLLAINSLSSIARSGYDRATIRAELEAAARDTDANVAGHAEEATKELMASPTQATSP